MPALARFGHERLEYLRRILTEHLCNLHAADGSRIGIAVVLVGDLLLVEDAHHIGFVFLIHNSPLG